MKVLNFNILTLILLVAMATTFTSCDEDPIMGCTDVDAENYDAAAEESDGNCTYARDKFLGDFSGDLACPGLLAAISNDMFPFTISESIDGGANEVDVLLVNLGVTLNGVIDGNTLTLDASIAGFEFMPDVLVDLTITGSADLDDAGSMLNGQLDIVANSAGTEVEIGTDSCALIGVKQ